MKKIGLFLESEPSGGGTFQYNQTVIDAVAALPSERFSVVVGYTSEQWLKYLKVYDVRTVSVPRSFWGRAFGLGWTLLGLPMGWWHKIGPSFYPMARTLIQEKCDLWIFPSHDVRSHQFPVPALVSIHDLMFRYERRFPESTSWWEYINRERSCRAICRWAKGVLVDSEVGRQQMIESFGVPAERVHVLPYVVPGYMHSGQVPEDFDSRYRLPSKYIFYPAQFWEHKNHKKLIQAVKALKGTLPDLKLVLSGSKQNAYESVTKLVRDLDLVDDVIFLGFVPEADMPEIYRRARALVMPTFYGPTNIPPLEAFGVGCPVATSGIYGMPEQVGDAALLFNPESVGEIADCIQRLWYDDRLCADLAEKGKGRVARWGQRQFNGRFREIVEEVITGTGNPG